MRTLHRRAALLAAALLLAAGCGGAPAEPDRPEPPQGRFEASFRWTTEPGTDLRGDAASAVRAVIESWTTIMRVGREGAYPGYFDAVSRKLLLNLHGSDGETVRGTIDAHLVIMEHGPYYVRAIVCEDHNGVAVRQPGSDVWSPGLVRSSRSPYRGIRHEVRSIGFEYDYLAAPSPPPAPGRLPQPRPDRDVLSGWKATHFTMAAAPRDGADVCDEWVRNRWGSSTPPAPTRNLLDPPPTLPYTPGW